MQSSPFLPGARIGRGTPAGRIKGAAFHEFLNWYAKHRGEKALQRAVGALTVEQRAPLDPTRPSLGVIASDWYPAATVHALLDDLTRDLPPETLVALADECASAIMSRTLRGFYRSLFEWMGTPERYAKLGPKLWSAYYDSGRYSIQMPDATTAISTVSDWNAHHAFMCDLNRGAAHYIYEAMGCHSVKIERTACIADGNGRCKFVARWK